LVGTGFLGRRIVHHLLDADLAVLIASRDPDRADSLFSGTSGVEFAYAEVNNDGSLSSESRRRLCVGSRERVNLYVERGKCTFRSVRVEAA
jgi:nucleoside-diphosphate-sugar epimerase